MAAKSPKKDPLDGFDVMLAPDATQFDAPADAKAAPPEPTALDEARRKQQAMGALVDAPGWSTFVTEVRDHADKMRKLSGVELAKFSPAEIGEKFLVANLAADAIESEITKVIKIAQAIKRNTPEE